MKKDKIDPIIKDKLSSLDTKVVISAINSIKEKGNKLYLPLLFDLLNSKPMKEVQDVIINLLETIKDKGAVESFINAIENEHYKPIWKLILAASWQNGLDFSDYLPVFIDKIINEEWEIAFEAFTVTDNFEYFPKQKITDESRKKIENVLSSVNEQKAYFLKEILTKLDA